MAIWRNSLNLFQLFSYLLVLIVSVRSQEDDVFVPPCDHPIFCEGQIIHTVQMSGIYNDSKTFVDRPLKYPIATVQANFVLFMAYHNNAPANSDISTFVDYNFELPGTEFLPWIPDDWKVDPAFLSKISDPGYHEFASDLHSFWEALGREMNPDVSDNPDKYSLIYVPHPVIVPGGRFREFYYWDSFWIQKGLLRSEMFETVRGMILNFAHMVNTMGFIPNGGRVYYQRSQPPLLIPMVNNYMVARNNEDKDFLASIISTLDAEFDFWKNNRSLTFQYGGNSYTMYRYNSVKNGPRPESYKEDFEIAEHLETDREKHELYSALHSGAESGFDFSSRWFVHNSKVRAEDLDKTSTRSFIPVDLNAFLYNNAVIMEGFHRELGNNAKADEYQQFGNTLKTAINTVLWDEALGAWFDYNHKTGVRHTEFYPSNIAPLWASAHASADVVPRVLAYLEGTGALIFPGGIPSSLEDSGEQWDFPNAWAPLVDLIIDGLDRSGNELAQAKAFELAQTWVATNYLAFFNSDPNHMYEKYNVTELGRPGGGGEYEVVLGFGWSNGVILDYLAKWGDSLVAPNRITTTTTTTGGSTTSTTTEGNTGNRNAISAKTITMVGCLALFLVKLS